MNGLGTATFSFLPTSPNGLASFAPFDPNSAAAAAAYAYATDPATAAAIYSTFGAPPPGAAVTSPNAHAHHHIGGSSHQHHLGGQPGNHLSHCHPSLGPLAAPQGTTPGGIPPSTVPYHPALFYSPHPTHITYIAQAPPPPGVTAHHPHLPVSQSSYMGTTSGGVTGLTLTGNGTTGYHGHHHGSGTSGQSPIPAGQGASAGGQSWGQPHYLTTPTGQTGPTSGVMVTSNPINHVS